MKMIQLFRAALMPVLLGLVLPCHAEDIDIYSATSDPTVPNVLFVIDTGANFSSSAAVPCTAYSAAAGGGTPSLGSTGGGVEQCALVDSIVALPEGTVNIGLLVNNNNNFATDVRQPSEAAYHQTCMGSAGGCVIRKLTVMTSTNKANLTAFIKSWKLSGNDTPNEFNVKSGGDATASDMQEAWAYYNGKIGMSGMNYSGSILGSGCQKNFIIFIGNSLNNSGGPADSATPAPDNATTGLRSTQVGATPAQLQKISDTVVFKAKTCGVNSIVAGNSASDWSQNWADEWARLMYQQDGSATLDGTQNITTYTIGVIDNSGNNTCKPDYPALLTTAAKHGGGKYFQTGNASEVKAALDAILNEIQAVNSVFSSASLPVSVNAQGTYLNQIFLGMFRPDGGANPRWLGNLKQYQFILTSSGLQLGDNTYKNGVPDPQPALSSAGTGFISPNAISFWTSKDTSKAPDSTGGFFVNDPKGAGGAYDSPDGEFVEKGGAAQQLRSALLTVNHSTTPAAPRRLYTSLYTNYINCLGATPAPECSLAHTTNVFAIGNSAISTTLLGVGDSTARTSLINWVRGQDNANDEIGPGAPVTVRPSIHGDVVHSRPVVINYGDSARGLVVFYGANDGVFRAVNGSQTAAIGSVPAGGELWGLVLPEHFGKLKRQRENTPNIHFPADNTTNVKDYFVDGSAGVYEKLKTDGTIDKAYLYLTMRRGDQFMGGHFIYALDVSDPTAPSVLWRIKSSDSGFAELGQTWSRPRVTLIKGYVDASTRKPKPVLVFGAGYNPAEDAEPPSAYATGSGGRGIFVLDAITGALIWRGTSATDTSPCPSTATCATVNGMDWAIPADISFVDRDNDGKTDRFYAADLGGNVWRVDLETNETLPDGTITKGTGIAPDKWKVSKLAALGCDAGVCASGTTPRKFFYPPNVVPVGVTDASDSYDAVLIGSGDREHPLKSTAAGSAYNVVNRFYMLKDTRTVKDASVDMTNYPITENKLFDATTATYPKTLKGFYMTLATGEKVVNASITVTGTTFFGTNRPKPNENSCIPNLGEAKGYALNPFQATYNSSIYDGGGLPPTPVAGVVSITTADGNSLQAFCVGCGGGSAIGAGADAKSTLGAVDLSKKVPKKPRRTYWYKQ